MVIRVRPLTSAYHASNGGNQLVNNQEEKVIIKRCIRDVIDDKIIVLDTKDAERFTFDFIAGENIPQNEMFNRLGKPIVDACLQGYNSTLFAYGQTGSGKTHTIQGKCLEEPNKKAGISVNVGHVNEANDDRGILPR